MSSVHNILWGLRVRPFVAVFVIGGLFVCTQIAEIAHAEVDCEHESCGLCLVSAGDGALVGDATPPTTPRRRQAIEPARSTTACVSGTLRTPFIRGPPAA